MTDTQTVGRLLTAWCGRSWGPLKLELRTARDASWSIGAVWEDTARGDIEGTLDNSTPPVLLLQRTVELKAADLPGADLSNAYQAFQVRAIIERTLATRPWLLSAEREIRNTITLKLQLHLTTEALDGNVFAAGLVELLKVPDAIRWAWLESSGAGSGSVAGIQSAVLGDESPRETASSSATKVLPERPKEADHAQTPRFVPPRAGAAEEEPGSNSGRHAEPEQIPSKADQEAVSFCSNCGRPLGTKHKFCMGCGTKVQ